ncbi:UvrD-helicase domain-containing protein [Brachyspira hyodysenteriae]|uniref:UvrD-helicase domain-containing protein n=1 Tax=Brachyspira hyodysenteriae TaxID=159 RepID=UPI0011833D20|nr:UvrD-helicase domain-containing protein [Brachyspira hyodysenteriae]TVL57322.1 DNA helicase UvrD [Brachyspira hyodysenteriae]TVL83383.1 DNA helicase UvrD [Brachyspira hyodysenteriae]
MVFNLNDKQKDIIKCFEDNGLCFVNASAGTGKTSTITEIYLKLLENKEKVSNIVVITFTKAAANEMLFRIRSKVRNKIDEIKNTNDEKSIKEKKYWQNVYKDILTSAKISTINAFANSITMENAMYLSIPPNMSILEDSIDIQETLKSEILNILRQSKHAEIIRSLYRISTEDSKNQFAQRILHFLLKIKPRLENINRFEEKALEIIKIDDKEYDKLYNNIYNYSIELINDNLKSGKFIIECKNRISLLLQKIDLIKNIEKVKELSSEDYEYMRIALSDVSNAKLGNTKHDEFRAVLEDLKQCTISMLNYVNILYNKENYKAVIDFIKETYNHIEKVKSNIGIYSHEDMMYKAIEALENDAISKEIRDNISSLILDEAQDTSILQFDFINLIVFGQREITSKSKTDKKLMIVGDRKQSIYRFRNADVNAFTNVQENFSNYVRYLKDNYRSNSMLIDFFNDLFKSTVFVNDDINYKDEDDLDYNKKTDDKAVSLLIFNNNIEDENIHLYADDKTELEAYAIAEYIKNNYSDDYKNTVILLQTFKRLDKYLQALSDYKIPYYIDGGNKFYSREEIVLIKTFLEYLILRDHAKLPEILRSELFDIDIGNLSDFLFSLYVKNLDIKDYFPKMVYDENKYKEIEDIAKSKSYYNQLKTAKEILNNIESKIPMMNAAEIIETICIDTNFYNYLMTMNDAEISYANIEKLKKIANDFENQTGNNIYDFVLNLKNTNDNEPYSAIPKLSVESVKIMTIHKSKGLEFNNVFVAGMGNYIRSYLSDFDFIEDSPFIRLPVRNKHYNIDFSASNTDDNKKSETSEKRRLLYVALTRASNNLILSGEHSKGESYRSYLNKYFNDEIKKYEYNIISEDTEGLIKIDDIENKFIDSYLYGLAIKPEEEINIIDSQTIKEKIKNISKENKKVNYSEYIKNINPSLNKNNKLSKNYVNISDLLDRKISELENDINNIDNEYNEELEFISYKDIGIIIHRMLEYFNFDKYKEEKEAYLEKVKSYILKSNNHYNKEQLTESLNTAFKKLFENHHIQNIFKGDEEILSREHTFQHYDGKDLITGKIDIITKNKNDEYYILDYKVAEESEYNINKYQYQLNSYKFMFEEVMKTNNADIDKNKIKTDIIFLK